MKPLRCLIPKACRVESADAKAVSYRWGHTGFDYVRTKKFTLLQYGSNPIKFIIKVPKGEAPPSFVLSHKWDIQRAFKDYLCGTTKKPLDLKPLWRKLQWKTSENSPGTKTKKSSSLLKTGR